MQRPPTVKRLKSALVPGQVYRRSDLARLSTNIDRHLAQLLAGGHLRKLSQGLYLAPRSTPYGEALPDEESLLRAFLKDDRFVVYSFNQFNSLELGTTQLYNQRVVFNRKRVGEFALGGRTYAFHRWREAPKTLSVEFLVVELLNRLHELAEDREQVLTRLRQKLPQFNRARLLFSVAHYGTLSTQKRLKSLIAADDKGQAA